MLAIIGGEDAGLTVVAGQHVPASVMSDLEEMRAQMGLPSVQELTAQRRAAEQRETASLGEPRVGQILMSAAVDDDEAVVDPAVAIMERMRAGAAAAKAAEEAAARSQGEGQVEG